MRGVLFVTLIVGMPMSIIGILMGHYEPLIGWSLGIILLWILSLISPIGKPEKK